MVKNMYIRHMQDCTNCTKNITQIELSRIRTGIRIVSILPYACTGGGHSQCLSSLPPSQFMYELWKIILQRISGSLKY